MSKSGWGLKRGYAWQSLQGVPKSRSKNTGFAKVVFDKEAAAGLTSSLTRGSRPGRLLKATTRTLFAY